MIESATMVSSILLGTLRRDMGVTCGVRLNTLRLYGVAYCWELLRKVGNRSDYVQTDATTPNNVGQQCWELFRPPARSLRTRVNENAPKMAIFKKAAQVLKY